MKCLNYWVNPTTDKESYHTLGTIPPSLIFLEAGILVVVRLVLEMLVEGNRRILLEDLAIVSV